MDVKNTINSDRDFELDSCLIRKVCLKRILEIFSYIINVGTNFGFVVSPFNDEKIKC